MIYLAWAVLLICQNAAFTWVSRARNSGSDWYHAAAAVFSNGIWFGSFFISIDLITQVSSIQEGALLGTLYIGCTVTGSVFAGRFLRRYVEWGALQVGHYEQDRPAGIRTMEPGDDPDRRDAPDPPWEGGWPRVTEEDA